MAMAELVLPDVSAIALAYPAYWLERSTADWLAARLLATLGELSHDLVIVTREDRPGSKGCVVVENGPWELQPWSSIRAGLATMRNERGLVVAADLPLLNMSLLRYMMLLSAHFQVVVPRVDGEIDPFLAVYDRSVIPALDRLIAHRGRDPLRFFAHLDVRYVDADEVELFDVRRLSLYHVAREEDVLAVSEMQSAEEEDED